MNQLELLVYGLVKNNPRIKNLVRDTYQALFSLFPVPRQNQAYPVTIREGYFFGFHDKNPWSFDNGYLLSHGYHGISHKLPRHGDQVDIGLFSGDDFSVFRKIATTSCYNWQQGSMLQWLGKTHTFIFNDVGGDDNTAKIFDIGGQNIGVLSKAIAAIDPEGKVALSYNFARLQRYFPGYGYLSGTDPENKTEIPSTHGISTIDIPHNLITKLFSVKDIASFRPEKSMQDSCHFLTHCLFSPSGKRFLFLHRWVKNGNITFTRMFSCDVNGHHLHLFPTRDMVSHIAWQDETHVLAYCRSKENKDGYFLFKDSSEEHRSVGMEQFDSDGHPSFPENSTEWFITDTYPDRFRRSYLILYNILKEKRFDLGYFRQPIKYKEAVRCDLHPRWNHDGSMICFDSAHSGKRSLCTIKIGDLLNSGITPQF
ncbi:MAG: hypothetical protein M0P58_10110 [Bacteroidales bacterium]|nr:hypothetical protein [Bacteroidales bacterium]